MSIYGFIAASEDQHIYHQQYFGILAYATNHLLGRVDFVEEAEFGCEDLGNRNLLYLVSKLSADDILIVSDLTRLGRSTWERIGMLMEIMKRRAVVCAVDEEYDLGGGSQYRGLPCVMSILLEARKELALGKSREAKNDKRAEGTAVLGRPVGRLGASRLDGREDEIKSLLADGVFKAEIARRMNVSRPALHDFILSRKLL